MPPLNIAKFNALIRSEQYDVVHNFGVYLCHHKKSAYLFALYKMPSFYVEVVFKSNNLIRVKAHNSLDGIEKFINKINIDELGLSS
jgi:hypothetical protein